MYTDVSLRAERKEPDINRERGARCNKRHDTKQKSWVRQNYLIFVTTVDKDIVIKDPVNDNDDRVVVTYANVDAIQEVDDVMCSLVNFVFDGGDC